MQEKAARGKYKHLFMSFLIHSAGDVWRTDFKELKERTDSSCRHPLAATEWWANDKTHSQARAWIGAGWKVAAVNIEAETVTFTRENPNVDKSLFDLEVVFPVHHAKMLLSDEEVFSREYIYDDRM